MLSGRNPEGGTFQNYAKPELPFGYHSDKARRGMTTLPKLKKLASALMEGKSIGEKFTYLNFARKSTIEYRLPASSTGDDKANEFSKIGRHLELMFATHSYSKKYELNEMVFTRFMDWLKSEKRYVNLYNSIVTNDRVLEEVINSAKHQSTLTIETPTLEGIDFTNSEDMESFEDNYSTFKKAMEKTHKSEEEAIKIVKKHKNKIIKKGDK